MPEDMQFDAAAFVRDAVDGLRRNLLDFSTRNRLLSFKHSERARDFIRAIDELPGEIYRRLIAGRMRFAPLPDPYAALPDEEAVSFATALRDLRQSDKDYADWAAHAPANSRAPFMVERALRDKVRTSLGLGPLLHKGKLDLSAFAEAHGIDPAYELPERGATSERYNDRLIQTLFLQDELERRARKLFERYEDHLQEKGINVLHAAFGFLEWYEDDASDTAHHAPLLLLPLNMARKAEQGRLGFEISGDDGDLEVNTTLFEFLKKDFHVVLPPFAGAADSAEASPDASTWRRNGLSSDQADALEAWLADVAEVIKGKRRWRVRRFVTVGTFPFSRISLYKDLETSSWPEDGLVSHSVVARLLGGLGRNDYDAPGGGNENYPLDDPAYAGKVPSIILDADSSQHSAIVDALSGHSLVIQGPPGTGKSQTIANTIAAAADAGKRVLFVAEKSAALNVVASRLRHCGFGPFMLELHSDKARKADVIGSLRERLVQAPAESPDGLGRKLERRRRRWWRSCWFSAIPRWRLCQRGHRLCAPKAVIC